MTALLQTVNCSELEWPLTNKTHPTTPTVPSSSPLGRPDLIENTTPTRKADFEVRRHHMSLILWTEITL